MNITAHIAICSLCCLLIFRAFEEGMILYWLRVILHRLTAFKYVCYIRKPIYDCMTCMCSVWGLTYIAVNHWLLGWDFTTTESVIFILAVGGLNTFFEAFLFLSRDITRLAEVTSAEYSSTLQNIDEAVSGKTTDQ